MKILAIIANSGIAIDAVLAQFLPPAARLAFYGAIGGVISMLTYKFISPQKKIAAAIAESSKARKELACYDGPSENLLPLAAKAVKTSLKHLGLCAVPAVLSSVPMLLIFFWVSVQPALAADWISAGPQWLRDWTIPFFASVLAVSLALKTALRVV